MSKTKTEVQTTKTEEVAAPAVVSKASQALAIYQEEAAKADAEGTLRSRVINRLKSELGMAAQGASTYFQNAKKVAAGGKVKHYYKGKAKDNTEDDSAETFGVQLKDGSLKVCSSQQELDDWKKDNAELIADEQQVDEAPVADQAA